MPRIGSKLQLQSGSEAVGVSRESRIVIGIDPSATATGLVSLDIDTLETKDFCIRSENTGPQRLEDIYYQIKDFVEAKPLHVCMEDYAFSPLTASQSHKLGEVGGAIKLGLWTRWACWPTLVTNNQAKKFCLGKGGGKVKITKAQILKGVYKKWGFDTNDDNIADAYIEARIARAIILQTIDLDYEADVLKSVMPRLWTEAPAAIRDKMIASIVYGNTSSAAI